MIEKGSLVLLVASTRRHLLTVRAEKQTIPGLGVIDTSRMVGKGYGEAIDFAGRELLLLPPNVNDRHASVSRKAQIILQKDCASIVYNCDIRSGSRVVEAGCGSGALTIVLANFVSPDGMVHSYDVREDFLRQAMKNIKNAGLADFVTFRHGDVTENIEEKDVDAVILDMPNPWDAVESSFSALKPGGMLATYSPNINQVENTCDTIKDMNFMDIRTIELLEREMVVRKGMTRPSFEMLGHTGYLTFARKIL